LREAIDRLIKVRLVGDIVAGRPVMTGNDSFSTYDEEDIIELSPSMLREKPEDLFALRVRGDSMIDAMVNDGDIVIMKQQFEARNGEMVAVWLRNDTTTLKYFFNEGKRIRLQPANPTMDAIYVDPAEVQVQGRVLMVLRQTA
ncbi:MAG TPA: S24 family peptidase, partial [Promineifilum sp.]|nr:S24 family peptidase [Promineifilum sp.]